jgi:5-formyltetrahydrofolate cyclo-ligase
LASKAALRAQILAQRDALDPMWRVDASRVMTAALLRDTRLVRAATISAYLSIGSEVDTRPLVGLLLSRGSNVVLPRIAQSPRRLELHRVSDLDHDLLPGVWGILEPDPARCPHVDPAVVDCALIPGVAFTPEGARMGYGAGFFDRLVPRLRPGVPRLAAAFGVQIRDRIPTGPHDAPVDAIFTEAGPLEPVRNS